MIESYIRPIYQRCLADIPAKYLAKFFSANMVTMLALIFGLLSAILLIFDYNIIACIILLLSGWLDTLDGTIARLTNKSNNIGAMLDILSDRIVEWAIILGLYALDPSRGLLCLLMLGSVLIVVTSFLLAGMFSPNNSKKSFNYTPNLMERPEAFLFFISMMLFPMIFTYLAIIFIILVLYTAFMRILLVIKNE